MMAALNPCQVISASVSLSIGMSSLFFCHPDIEIFLVLGMMGDFFLIVSWTFGILSYETVSHLNLLLYQGHSDPVLVGEGSDAL